MQHFNTELTADQNAYLHESHVDTVHVWPLLPVNFNADEELVQDLCNSLALEGLALHDVTPVTCRVAHRQEDWLIFCFGFLDRFTAPGIPVFQVG